MPHAQESGASSSASGPLNAFDLLARWNYSLAAFYVRRFQRQMELPLRMLRTAAPADLMEIRRSFEADLLADYADQAAELHVACGHASDPVALPQGDYGAQLLKAQEHAAALIEQAKVQAERIIARAKAQAVEISAEADGATPPGRRSAAV